MTLYLEDMHRLTCGNPQCDNRHDVDGGMWLQNTCHGSDFKVVFENNELVIACNECESQLLTFALAHKPGTNGAGSGR